MTLEEGGRRTCIKVTIILVNIPVALFGLVAAGLGIWIAMDDPSFMHFTHLDEIELFDTSYVKTGSYIIVAGGFGVALFGILGIVAAATESMILLAAYTMLIALAMAVEVAATVLGVVFKHTVENTMEKAIGRSIKEEFEGVADSDNAFTIHFNAVQQKLECCGFNNSADFSKATKWNTTVDNVIQQIPPACCKNMTLSDQCVANPTPVNSYTMGCKEALADLFERYFSVIIGVAATLVFCQLVMMILSFLMMCTKVENSYNFKE
ncbi:tetraspanin-1-like [Mytilus edulis]|uniref:tetraspanin-1-like n=1 Tax=Mytilus edulis TaxID=6550 RepID=UPI0039EDEEAB